MRPGKNRGENIIRLVLGYGGVVIVFSFALWSLNGFQLWVYRIVLWVLYPSPCCSSVTLYRRNINWVSYERNLTIPSNPPRYHVICNIRRCQTGSLRVCLLNENIRVHSNINKHWILCIACWEKFEIHFTIDTSSSFYK